MSEVLALLRKNPVLARADDAVLSRLARGSRVRYADKGDVVVRADTPQSELYLIAQGGLELSRRDRHANSQLLFGTLFAPSIFGDAELYSEKPWLVTARAETHSILVAMPTRLFESAVASDVTLAAGLYRDACCRHYLAMQIMQVLALQRAPARLLSLLWEQAEPADDKDGTRRVHFAPVALGKALGVDRKTVARNLEELESRGLVQRDGASTVILSTPPVGGGLGMRGFGATWRMSRR